MKTLILSLVLASAAMAELPPDDIKALEQLQHADMVKLLTPARKKHAAEWQVLAKRFVSMGRIADAAAATQKGLSLSVLGNWARKAKGKRWDVELGSDGRMFGPTEAECGRWSLEKNVLTLKMNSGWVNTFPISDNGEISEGEIINPKGQKEGTVQLEPRK